MIYLNFMRHAKTDCSSYNGNDFNRPVSRNGILQTEAVKKFLKTKNWLHVCQRKTSDY